MWWPVQGILDSDKKDTYHILMQEWVIRQQFFKIVSFSIGIAPYPSLSVGNTCNDRCISLQIKYTYLKLNIPVM